MLALLLELPSRNSFESLSDTVDPIIMYKRKKDFMKKIASSLKEVFEISILKLMKNKIHDHQFIDERALVEKILKYLLLIDNKIGIEIAKKISNSKNMTLSIIGLKSLCLEIIKQH